MGEVPMFPSGVPLSFQAAPKSVRWVERQEQFTPLAYLILLDASPISFLNTMITNCMHMIMHASIFASIFIGLC